MDIGFGRALSDKLRLFKRLAPDGEILSGRSGHQPRNVSGLVKGAALLMKRSTGPCFGSRMHGLETFKQHY
jgi:hypothetical protein